MSERAPRFFSAAQAFRDWLAHHAATEAELIVGFHKVATGQSCMTWSESVDEALCFGWIDGVRKRIDDDTYQIRFTPRKPTSIWSTINIAKVQALQAQGRMTPAGERAFALRADHRSAVYSHEQPAVAEWSTSPVGNRFFRVSVVRSLAATSAPAASKRSAHPRWSGRLGVEQLVPA